MTKHALRWLSACLILAACIGGPRTVAAETATVAVAANFLVPAEALQKLFEANGPHRLKLVSGSTGQLYAQTSHGAPFDVLLSADQDHVGRLVTQGLAVASDRFTYATGKLALWTADPARFAPLGLETLGRKDFRWLAIANPELAPYGLAAKQTLVALRLWESLQARLVRGQSIAQTFAMAATGNADLAFVALSQTLSYQGAAACLEIPVELYEPLRQDAALLSRGANNAAARAFLQFLRSPEAARVIERFGYSIPGAGARE